MRLFFLGTGAAEGVPALFCECALCAAARRLGGRDLRTRTSVLVANAVRIDLPPDALVHSHRYPDLPLSRLRYLLFTHSHDDHFAIRELQYLSPTFSRDRACPMDIWLSKDCLEQLRPVAARFFEKIPTPLHVVEPYETVKAGPLFVTPILARHKEDEQCFNYLLSETPDGPALLYASDTGWYQEPTWEYLATRSLRAVVMECGNGTIENGYYGHLSISDCLRAKDRLIQCGALARDAPFFLTHLSHAGGLTHAEWIERVAGHNLTIAYDGLDVDI